MHPIAWQGRLLYAADAESRNNCCSFTPFRGTVPTKGLRFRRSETADQMSLGCDCNGGQRVRGLRGGVSTPATVGVRTAVGLGIAGALIIGMLALVTR